MSDELHPATDRICSNGTDLKTASFKIAAFTASATQGHLYVIKKDKNDKTYHYLLGQKRRQLPKVTYRNS